MNTREDFIYAGVMSRAVKQAYIAGEEDEAMEPIVLTDRGGRPAGRIKDGDYVIFYDIRGEREIELTEAMTEKDFTEFSTGGMTAHFVTMIEYAGHLDVKVAFPPPGQIQDTLVETIIRSGRRVVKIVETEKAIHLGYFFNGKREEKFSGEERVMIPSPKVEDYSTIPELNIKGVAAALIEQLQDKGNHFIVANYANIDVLGHIENRGSILKAINHVDHYTGMVVEAARQEGFAILVTADHGTVEKWFYPDGTVDTGHTDSPVPCILIPPAGEDWGGISLHDGELTDVAPTLLSLMGLETPPAMTGSSLITGEIPQRERRVLLLIMDGWGIGDGSEGDLITAAETPNLDNLLARFPNARLQASGEAVGMPGGTVGNSEAGHLHLGCGRKIYSDRFRIDKALKEGAFAENETFLWAIDKALQEKKPLHLLGIVSFYSSHGSLDHLFGLMELAREKGIKELYIHSLLGRRGERPEAGARYISDVEQECREQGLGKVVSVIGRFWALDREENWDRIEKTYRALVHGEGRQVREE